jgi:hypothetical protein
MLVPTRVFVGRAVNVRDANAGAPNVQASGSGDDTIKFVADDPHFAA